MGIVNHLQQVLTAFAVASSVSTVDARYEVNLPGYGNFMGTTINQTLTRKSLPVAVDAWLGIEYASQPIGEGRFAPVGPPAPFYGTKNATKFGYSCVQDSAMVPYDQDEACLSMNVFRPQKISTEQKLPVLLWIHGVSN